MLDICFPYPDDDTKFCTPTLLGEGGLRTPFRPLPMGSYKVKVAIQSKVESFAKTEIDFRIIFSKDGLYLEPL